MTQASVAFSLTLCLLLSACGGAAASSSANTSGLAPTSIPPAALAPSPTALPTLAPSPTALPTALPSPTALPTLAPSRTAVPSVQPSPTALPTALPSPTAVPSPTPPTTSKTLFAPTRLVIGKLDLPLVSVGLDSKRVPVVPDHDVGWYNLSGGPGQGENIVLWGHVLRFKSAPNRPAPFAGLKDLPVGSEITLYSADGQAHRYVVSEKVWATPDQVQYILPKGRELLTMVSCIGDKVVVDDSVEMTHRLITIAEPAP